VIGGPNPIASMLSRIYAANNKSIANSLSRIASGKRIQTAGDDFAGFLRAADLENDISAYQVVIQDLTDAKGIADYAEETASDIAEDLDRLRELVTLYAGTTDSSYQSSYQAEFDSLVSTIDNAISSNRYDGTQVVQSGTVTTIDLDPNGSGNNITLSFAASDIVDTSNLSITDESTITSQISVAAQYLYKAKYFAENLERHINLNETIISSKEATASVITDIDDAKEMSNLTDLQVRQQAAAAMLAQANNIRAIAAKLYNNET